MKECSEIVASERQVSPKYLSIIQKRNFSESMISRVKALFTCRRIKTELSENNDVIGHYRNVRGLGKSMVVFRLFEKLRYSNERSIIF